MTTHIDFNLVPDQYEIHEGGRECFIFAQPERCPCRWPGLLAGARAALVRTRITRLLPRPDEIRPEGKPTLFLILRQPRRPNAKPIWLTVIKPRAVADEPPAAGQDGMRPDPTPLAVMPICRQRPKRDEDPDRNACQSKYRWGSHPLTAAPWNSPNGRTGKPGSKQPPIPFPKKDPSGPNPFPQELS
jgi:hypothetical protein